MELTPQLNLIEHGSPELFVTRVAPMNVSNSSAAVNLAKCPKQFLSSLAQNASRLLIAPHSDERIEQVVVTAPAIDQTPTLQPSELAYDRSTGHAHIGSNLGDRKRLAVDVTHRNAQGDKKSF
jgi:hypothetical protein